MGHKIFISYKYADENVKHIVGEWYETNTVRNYVDQLESYLKDSSDHIYKGESDGEDLSQLSEETIWNKLKDRIYDSTLTIVIISKNMKENWKAERDQWIPWEISYSLKEVSREDKNGKAISSKTNAVLAIVVPDNMNSYSYYTYQKKCCSSGCRVILTDTFFGILKRNMFNEINPNTNNCTDGSTVYYGDSSYIISIKWDDFIVDVNKYINEAYNIQKNIDNYNIYKDLQ